MKTHSGFPILIQLSNGHWAAEDAAWAVHGSTQNDAIQKYEERLEFYRWLSDQPYWFVNPTNPMSELNKEALRDAVEGLHDCRAEFTRFESVTESFEGEIVWEGSVAIFNLAGHPSASVCYAWSSPTKGSEKRRFYAILRKGPVQTPRDAVRASILSDSYETD